MGVSTGTALLTAATVGSAYMGKKAADKQSDAIKSSSNKAIDAENYRTDRAIALTAPNREVGNQALNAYASMFIPGYSGFEKPEYAGGGGGPATGGWTPPYAVGQTVMPSGDWTGDWTNDLLSSGFLDYINQKYPDGRNAPGARTLMKEMRRFVGQQQGRDPDIKDKHLQPLARMLTINRGRWGQMVEEQAAVAEQAQNSRFEPISADDLSAQYAALPGVEFQQNEADKAVANSALLTGVSGNTIADLSERNRQMAYNTVVPNLANLAGYSATGSANAANIAGSSQIPSIIGNTGVAQANIEGGKYASLNNAIQGGMSNWMMYKGLNPSPVAAPAAPAAPPVASYNAAASGYPTPMISGFGAQ